MKRQFPLQPTLFDPVILEKVVEPVKSHQPPKTATAVTKPLPTLKNTPKPVERWDVWYSETGIAVGRWLYGSLLYPDPAKGKSASMEFWGKAQSLAIELAESQTIHPLWEGFFSSLPVDGRDENALFSLGHWAKFYGMLIEYWSSPNAQWPAGSYHPFPLPPTYAMTQALVVWQVFHFQTSGAVSSWYWQTAHEVCRWLHCFAYSLYPEVEPQVYQSGLLDIIEALLTEREHHPKWEQLLSFLSLTSSGNDPIPALYWERAHTIEIVRVNMAVWLHNGDLLDVNPNPDGGLL